MRPIHYFKTFPFKDLLRSAERATYGENNCRFKSKRPGLQDHLIFSSPPSDFTTARRMSYANSNVSRVLPPRSLRSITTRRSSLTAEIESFSKYSVPLSKIGVTKEVDLSSLNYSFVKFTSIVEIRMKEKLGHHDQRNPAVG